LPTILKFSIFDLQFSILNQHSAIKVGFFKIFVVSMARAPSNRGQDARDTETPSDRGLEARDTIGNQPCSSHLQISFQQSRIFLEIEKGG
jgi:hypothetical protein